MGCHQIKVKNAYLVPFCHSSSRPSFGNSLLLTNMTWLPLGLIVTMKPIYLLLIP